MPDIADPNTSGAISMPADSGPAAVTLSQITDDFCSAVLRGDEAAFLLLETWQPILRPQIDQIRRNPAPGDSPPPEVERLDLMLVTAVGKGGARRTQLLLALGADPNAVDLRSGMTPLLMSRVRRFEKCLQAVIKAGANIEAQDVTGETPLTHGR